MYIPKFFRSVLKDYYQNKVIFNCVNILRKIHTFQNSSQIVDIVSYKKDFDNVLVISPHPDDESIGLGGFLSSNNYRNLDLLLITRGECGIDGAKPSHTVAIRKNEFESALKGINYTNVINSNAIDGLVYYTLDIPEELDFSNYTSVFLPNPFELHPDHKAATERIINKLYKSYRNCKTVVYFYEVWSPLPCINVKLSSYDFFQKKIVLINNYKSQLNSVDYCSLAKSLAEYRGIVTGSPYSETYLRLSLKDALSLYE